MVKHFILIFLVSALNSFGQEKKIKVKKEASASDTINIVGVWSAKVLNDVGTGTGRVWEFKADGTFIEKRGNDGNVFYRQRPDGKYNFTNNILNIFQVSASGYQSFNFIYSVEKKKDYLLLTITKDSYSKGPSKKMTLTKRLD